MSDSFGPLPAGWAETTIEQIFDTLEDGRTLHQGWSPQCEAFPATSEETWGVLRTTAIQAGRFCPEHNKQLPSSLEPRPNIQAQAGDIILTCAGPRSRCGVACLVRQTRKNLMLSGKMYRFRVPEQEIEPRYVEAYLQTAQAQAAINRMKTGGSDSGLNLTHERFRQLPIRIAPRKEQERIADVIEEALSDLDAGLQALENAQTKLALYRTSVLKAAAQGDLTAGWRKEHPNTEAASILLQRILKERRQNWEQEQVRKFKAAAKSPSANWKSKYKEPVSPITDNLPSIPHSWCWASVEQISTKVVDGVHSKPHYVPTGIPFVTVKNLTAGSGISFEKLHYITKDDHAEFIKRADPEYGDILLSKDGTLGVMRVVKTHQVFSIFVSVALIKPVVRNSSDFLGLVLSSPQVQVQMVPKGTGLVHIHLEDLREDCLPLAPTSEQIAILELTDEQVSVIDYLQSQISKKAIAVSNLRQAILQQAFSGKLVPQDQSDEPASSLVSRIAAARGANERAKLKSPTTKASKSKRRTT